MAKKTAPKPPDAPMPPEQGSVLSQLHDLGILGAQGRANSVSSQVIEVIGEFKPQLVTLERRLQMLNDPDVAFGFAILSSALTGMRFSLSGDNPDSVAFVEQEIARHQRQLFAAASMALPLGNQPFEKVWTSRDVEVERSTTGGEEKTVTTYPSAWVYEKFKQLDPRRTSILVNGDQDEWAGLEQSVGLRNGGLPRRVGTDRAILWSFWKHRVFGRLSGFPITNQCFEPWWQKVATVMYLNRYMERRAEPPYLARGPVSVTDTGGKIVTGPEYVRGQLVTLKNGGIAFVPSQKHADGSNVWDIGFLADDKRGDAFLPIVNNYCVQILRGLLIPDRAATTGDGTGSYAQAEVHADVLAHTMESIQQEFVADVLEPQVIDPLVLYNFGQDELRNNPVRVKLGGLSSEKKGLLLEIVKAVMQGESISAPAGGGLLQRVDAGRIAEQLEIPLLSAKQVEERQQVAQEEAEEQGENNSDLDDSDEPGIDQERVIADDLIRRGVAEPE